MWRGEGHRDAANADDNVGGEIDTVVASDGGLDIGSGEKCGGGGSRGWWTRGGGINAELLKGNSELLGVCQMGKNE